MGYYFTLVKKWGVFFTFGNGPLEINLFIFQKLQQKSCHISDYKNS